MSLDSSIRSVPSGVANQSLLLLTRQSTQLKRTHSPTTPARPAENGSDSAPVCPTEVVAKQVRPVGPE